MSDLTSVGLVGRYRPQMQNDFAPKLFPVRRVLAGTLVVLLVVFLLWGTELGTAYSAVVRTKCMRNLKSIDAVLLEHQSKGEPLPTSEGGRLSLKSLLDSSSGSHTVGSCSGHSRNADDIYLVAPRFFERLDAKLANKLPTIIICDKPGNHIMRRWNGLALRKEWQVQEMACMLLSSGDVIFWHGNTDDYAEWANGFSSGKGDVAQYPPGIEERLRGFRQDFE